MPKYLNQTGLKNFWKRIKKYIPTKLSDLTNDPGFITGSDLPTNHVTTNTTQTITGDKTWTGEQSFTLPIVGSITGTASKAIADEDGNSIKTGYGKLAGNQTWTGTNSFHNLNPETNSTYSLGTSSLKWSNIYGDNFYSTNYYTIVAYTRNASDQPTVTAFIREFKVDSADGKSFSRYATTVDKTYTNMQLIATMYDSNGDVDNEMRVRMQVSASDKIFIPGTNSDVKLGTSTNQWSSVYAQTYYYNGTAWGLDKANVWTGDNTYTKYQNIIIAGTEIGVAPNNQNRNGLLFKDKNNETLGWVRSVYDSTGDLSIEMLITNKYSNGALDPNGTQTYQGIKQTLSASGDVYFGWSGRVNNHVVPRTNNSLDLGTSTNKWKTLNGINPGALSLPSRAYNDSIALDTTDWDYAGNGFIISMADNNGDYIPGWVVIVAEDVGDVSDFIKIRLTQYTRSPGLDFTTFYTGSQYNIKACFSTSGIGYLVLKLTNGASCIKYARYYPCLGNV